MTPAEGVLTDRLAHGEAVPGGPGACARQDQPCHHAMVWHNPRNRVRECERPDCGCPSYVRPLPAARPGHAETRLLRAIYGACPDHDSCTPDMHSEAELATPWTPGKEAGA